MELPSDVIEGLRYLNDVSVVSDKVFHTLVATVCESLATNHTLPNEKPVPGMTPLALKVAFATLSCLMLEISKMNTDPKELSNFLIDMKIKEDRAKILSSAYETHKESYRKNLSSTHFVHPRVVDVSWELQHCIKNSYSGKVSQPKYLIELKTLNADGKIKNIQMFCTKDQLAEIVGKLQDACKSMERLAS